MNTIIGIPAMGSYYDPGDSWDGKDEPEEETEDLESVDIYERPYHILFDGVSEALRLLRSKEYEKAKERLMQAQLDADEAVCN